MKPQYNLFFLLLSLIMFGCGGGGGSDTPPPTQRVLTSIAISGAQTSYLVGASDTLSVTGTYNNGTTAALSGITWSSSTASVASISTSGVLTGVAEGTTTITATSNSLSNSVDITILPPTLDSIAVVSSNGSSSVPLGTTLQLTARGSFSNGVTQDLSDVAWSSGSAGIATISATGLVTSVSAGNVTLTAEKSGESATFAATVSAPALQSINIQISDSSVAAGTTTQATALGTFTNSTTAAISPTWTSSNAQVASVNAQGVITGVSVGDAVISAASSGITSNNSTVTITAAIATGLDTSPGFTDIPLGSQQTLVADIVFSNNTTQPATQATWASSNDAVASVSTTNGTVTITGITKGSAEITASAMGFLSSFPVTITDAIAVSVAFDKTEVALPKGASENLSLTASLSDNSTMNVTGESAFTVEPANLGTFATPSATNVTFTAVEEGAGTITAQYKMLSATIPVEVNSAEAVSLEQDVNDSPIAEGVSGNLSVTVAYSDDSRISPASGVAWSIADEAIASISASGSSIVSVTGKAAGSTVVTAVFGGLSQTFDLVVTDAEPASLAFVAPQVYQDQDSVQLNAILTFTDATTTNVSSQVVWSSSDDAVATISNSDGSKGALMPVSAGDVVITAVFGDTSITATQTITVLEPRIITGFSVYSYNDNASVTIGEGNYEFTLDFVEVDDDSIILNNVDATGVAVNTGMSGIESVLSTSGLDFSSSTAQLMQNSTTSVATINNANNVKAVIQVHEVKRFGDNNSGNLVMFSWAIRSDGADNFSIYTVEEVAKFFECREPTFTNPTRRGTCTELAFSYVADISANVSQTPRPDNFLIASFVLVSVGRDYEITNLAASDATNTVVPFFDGLQNRVISQGHGVSFKLMIPATNTAVEPSYSFNIDIREGVPFSFSLSGTFVSN